MFRSRGFLFAVGLIVVIALVPLGVLAQRSSSPPGLAKASTLIPVCPGPAAQGTALCDSIIRVDKGGNNGNGNGHGKPTPTPTSTSGPTPTTVPTPTPTPTTSINGYSPSDLLAAYNLATAAADSGNGATVAIVDAYDDPYAESDLNVYRSQFGLTSCTTKNGCFTKIDQNGGQHYPRANGGWSQEISLDLDMVSAICPKCNILLVEASSSRFTDLGTAENTAATYPGVVAVSNSWGGGDSSSDTSYDKYFNHSGVDITASAGDSGYGVEYPAASPYVTAVGGTSLNAASNSRGWAETVWSGTGSGCSAYEPNPGWQPVTSVCSNRTVADVSAVADPYTGVAVYDSYSYQGLSGWLVFGGTSVASPIIASVYALAGNTAAYGNAQYLYTHQSSSNFYDVTSGSNGSCGGTYLCTGVSGYDGPTGLGTPNGIGGF